VLLHDENDGFRNNNKVRIIFQKNNSEKDLDRKITGMIQKKQSNEKSEKISL